MSLLFFIMGKFLFELITDPLIQFFGLMALVGVLFVLATHLLLAVSKKDELDVV